MVATLEEIDVRLRKVEENGNGHDIGKRLEEMDSNIWRSGADSVGHARRHGIDDHLPGGIGRRIQDLDNDTYVDTEITPNENIIRAVIAGTARLTMRSTGVLFAVNEGATGNASVRLDNRVGIGTAPQGAIVLEVGIPTVGSAISTQLRFSGTKEATGDGALINLVSMITTYEAKGFAGQDFRGFIVSPVIQDTPGTGDFLRLAYFRLVNNASVVADKFSFFDFAHPTPGAYAYTHMAAFNFEDFDDGGGVANAYGLRFPAAGGSVIAFGASTVGFAGVARPISQEETTETIGGATFYNVIAGNTAFGANQQPSAFVDIAASTATYPSARIRAGTAPSSPLEGDVWNDSTRKSLVAYEAGVKQQDTRTLFTQVSHVALANSATETSILGTLIGTKSLPADFFTPGKTLRFRAWGFWATDATAAQTLTMRIRIGGMGGTIMAATSPIACATLVANRIWRVEIDLTCRTTGATGTVMSQGGFWTPDSVSAITNDFWAPMVATTSVTLDTTVANNFEFSADWNSADPGDTITCTNATLEVLN
jgi:hypothetical protein